MPKEVAKTSHCLHHSVPEVCLNLLSASGQRHSWMLALCCWLVQRAQATSTETREQLLCGSMYRCRQSLTQKIKLISSKCKFTMQDYNFHGKNLEISRSKVVANYSPRSCGHRKRQTCNLLFLWKQWIANSLHSSMYYMVTSGCGHYLGQAVVA